MNSASLYKLNLWKERLEAKKAGKPLDPEATIYESSAHTYEQMPGEVKLIFDALSDVLEALTAEER